MLRIVESTIAQQAYLDFFATDIPFAGVGKTKAQLSPSWKPGKAIILDACQYIASSTFQVGKG